MAFRLVLVAILLGCSGCVTSSIEPSFDCPDDVIADWEISAGSLVRPLSPEQAHSAVLTGNLPIDGIRDRWDSLQDQWQVGDQYWLYFQPEEPWINATGVREGVVLVRGCSQLGFVTSSIGKEGPPDDQTR